MILIIGFRCKDGVALISDIKITDSETGVPISPRPAVHATVFTYSFRTFVDFLLMVFDIQRSWISCLIFFSFRKNERFILDWPTHFQRYLTDPRGVRCNFFFAHLTHRYPTKILSRFLESGPFLPKSPKTLTLGSPVFFVLVFSSHSKQRWFLRGMKINGSFWQTGL